MSDTEVLDAELVDEDEVYEEARELQQIWLGLHPYVLIQVTPNEAGDDVNINLSAGGWPNEVTREEIANLLEEMAGSLRAADEAAK